MDEIIKYIYETLAALRGGAQPIIFMDLNDMLGQPQYPNEATEDGDYVGSINPGAEEYAATRLRRLLRDLGLCAINTFYDAGPTYWSTRRTGKRIDFIIVPVDWKPDCKACNTLKWTGRQLQLANTMMNWDHWPIAAAFLREDVQPGRQRKDKIQKWDQEALNHCLLHGTDRQRLLDNLSEKVEQRYEEIDKAFCDDPTPDNLDQIMINMYKEAAQGLFFQRRQEQGRTEPDGKEKTIA